jgi:hypothetical protein
VIRKTVGGRRAIADETVADRLRLADEKLHDLRVRFQENIGQRIIQQSGSMLLIPPKLQSDLTVLRTEAVAAVNEALEHAGLQRI